MAVKRQLEDLGDVAPRKRPRQSNRDHIGDLSDELWLRIFSHLSVSTLCTCERVSRRFSAIAGDSQIWKEHYYNRFVRPRAARLPGVKDAQSNGHLYFSSKLSKWLDEDSLVKRGRETNWRKQYKLRHNWTRGNCDISEIHVAEQPPIPPLLVRLQDGVLFTVDSIGGLRAWSAKKERRLLTAIPLNCRNSSPPTSLTVDAQGENGDQRVVVGFQDGHFSIYDLDRSNDAPTFRHSYSHAPSTNGMLTAVAYASPYLLTMTAGQLLSLYVFEQPSKDSTAEIRSPPRLLYSLKSHTVHPPLSLSVRPSSTTILASIAYALPTYFSGWSVGVQELKLSLSGELIDSRLATSSNESRRTLASSLPASLSPTRPGSPSVGSQSDSGPEADTSRTQPTSLSYNHPYLLLSHPDNTLTLFLVTSTSTSLSISPGSRLWGHTSSVSGAYVGGRGKAVSVSSHGDELRIWELEGGLNSLSMRKRLSAGQLSVRVQSSQKSSELQEQNLDVLSDAIAQRGSGLGLAMASRVDELSITRGWVGFDEENVVVLREKSNGGQALVVYDFT
ncbi:hypothetical protein NA57DRAFT_41725 [Rhizodiscina lignyota]|uniref:F-box domain-containing protein n=1 Tax=Rhizodiscina lignyota TaxID=1504668 RepID=A0A9P4IAV3_9PEZI|nr:hypothetical protein NA57DRAFT_41725 [Rhizodiscina lignyota]